MVKVRDNLTGEIIDVSNDKLPALGIGGNVGGSSAVAQPQQQGASFGSSGDSMQNMRKLIGMMILSKAKKPSDVATAFQLMEPTAQELKSQEGVNETKKFISKIDRAIALLKDTKNVKTGALAGPILKLKTQVLNGGTEKQRQAYNLLGELEAQKMFEIGGKVLPAQEIDRLTTFLPDYRKPNITNINDLTEWRNSLTTYGLKQTSQTEATQTGTTQTEMTGTNEDDTEGDWETY